MSSTAPPGDPPPNAPRPAKAARQRGFMSIYAGRMNRKVFALSAGALVVVAIGLSYVPGFKSSGAWSTVLWISLYNRRLHDIGQTGWWQMALYLIQISVAFAFVFGDQTNVGLGLATLIQLVFTVALGAIPGNREANQYGPPPGAKTAEETSEVFE